MEATLRINSYSELNTNLFTKLIKDIVTEFGSVEITIKPRVEYNKELLRRVEEARNGSELFSFSNEEFELVSKKMHKGETVERKNFKKVKKNENGDFVSC